MKGAVFLGDSLKAIREFPEDARRMAGRQIGRVQRGAEPIDWKPSGPTCAKFESEKAAERFA